MIILELTNKEAAQLVGFLSWQTMTKELIKVHARLVTALNWDKLETEEQKELPF